MDVTRVVFLLTDRCNAACPVCCFQCNPGNHFVMDLETIKRYMREGAELGTVRKFSFSGGEPFLYPELLKEAVRYGKETFGIPSGVVSNGFWAENYEEGDRLIGELKACGLKSMKLSADPYHQAFVPASAVKNAVRILRRHQIEGFLTIMEVRDRTHLVKMMEALRPEIYMIDFGFYPLLLTEKARRNAALKLTDEDIIRPCPWERCGCTDMGDVYLSFDGYMYACCSQFSFEIPRLRLGKTGQTTLKEAARRMNRDPVLDMMHRGGPPWFARKAKERGIPVQERYSVSCELCRDMLCNQAFMESVEPEMLEEIQRLRLEKLFA